MTDSIDHTTVSQNTRYQSQLHQNSITQSQNHITSHPRSKASGGPYRATHCGGSIPERKQAISQNILHSIDGCNAGILDQGDEFPGPHTGQATGANRTPSLPSYLLAVVRVDDQTGTEREELPGPGGVVLQGGIIGGDRTGAPSVNQAAPVVMMAVVGVVETRCKLSSQPLEWHRRKRMN